MTPRHVLVAGCGWLGAALARELAARGARVTAVRRDAARAEALALGGVATLALDLAAPAAAGRLPRGLDAVIACQAADGDTPEAYRRAYLEANRALLAHAADVGVSAFVYTGSTAVFGQRDGSDVDEETPVAPASATAEVLAEAERVVLDAARGGVPGRVVRLSGLYGPGRTGLLDRVRSGAMGLGDGEEEWTNWCRLEDAVGIVLAALEAGRAGAVYHGSDAEPLTRREVVTWIAGRLGVGPARAPWGRPARPRSNRRVRSERTRAELRYALRYPSLFAGLEEFLRG